ncbi:MAG: hypothetical protein JWP18_48 [Solirubrobacterales bacterium]|nr:hypothetical protein [Solirubrobacterales bacterium]
MRERIVAFLQDVGIPAPVADLPDPDACFLPGVRVHDGQVLHDPARLTWPGDLLHEAGHLALLPPAQRRRLDEDVALPGVDMLALEAGAMAWSYAAALHLDIDPAVVFHEGGYRGRARSLLLQLRLGVVPGLHVLIDAGLTSRATAAEGGYPAMQRWLAA